MAEIRKLIFVRHLRGEPSTHILRYRKGRLVASGRGLSFWFMPLSTGIAAVPMDNRELHFVFHGRTSDFQDVAVQGVVTYRIAGLDEMAVRVRKTEGRPAAQEDLTRRNGTEPDSAIGNSGNSGNPTTERIEGSSRTSDAKTRADARGAGRMPALPASPSGVKSQRTPGIPTVSGRLLAQQELVLRGDRDDPLGQSTELLQGVDAGNPLLDLR